MDNATSQLLRTRNRPSTHLRLHHPRPLDELTSYQSTRWGCHMAAVAAAAARPTEWAEGWERTGRRRRNRYTKHIRTVWTDGMSDRPVIPHLTPFFAPFQWMREKGSLAVSPRSTDGGSYRIKPPTTTTHLYVCLRARARVCVCADASKVSEPTGFTQN